MYRKITFAIAVSFAMISSAVEQADTVKVIKNPNNVVITENPKGVRIDVTGNEADSVYHYSYESHHSSDTKVSTRQSEERALDWNIEIPFRHDDKGHLKPEKKYSFDLSTSGLYIGWGWNNVDKAFPDFRDNIGHEYEVGILNLLALGFNARGNRLTLGFGMEYRRYHIRHFNLDRTPENVVVMTDFPEGSTKSNANVKAFSLQFPLIYHRYLPKRWSVMAGGIMNVNTGCRLSTEYSLDGRDYSVQMRHLQKRDVTFDVIGGIQYNGLGMYVRYRPQGLFKDGYGPKMSTISMGFGIAF
ncbi:MAG: hypothetical protein J5784_02585 [Muribaculaceae bacterium]|nr:hypothetical protein [Muribaculaceae bacterium]